MAAVIWKMGTGNGRGSKVFAHVRATRSASTDVTGVISAFVSFSCSGFLFAPPLKRAQLPPPGAQRDFWIAFPTLSSSMGVEGGSEGYAQVTRLWARGLIWNQRHRLIIKLQTCAFAQGKDQRTLCGCEGANFLLPVCWLPAGFSRIEATTPPRSRTHPFA